jgi:O-succinylbenzoic acid--CoA ligase
MSDLLSFEKLALSFPDRPALFFGDRVVGYGELSRRVKETECGLAGLGVGVGDVVAVLLENSLAYAELLHAIAKHGATLLPLNTRLTPIEIAFQLENSGARWLLNSAGVLGQLASASLGEVGCSEAITQVELGAGDEPALAGYAAEGTPADRRSGTMASESTLALVYTSGTTGRPKGVKLSVRSFYWSAIGSAMHLGVEADDRWLVCLPLFHVGGLSILLRSALNGTAAILHPGFDPAAVNRALDDEAVTLVSLVPTMLGRLLDARGEKRAPSSLRAVLLGGSGCSGGLLERARAQGFPVACTYGLTEATSQVATQPVDSAICDGAAGLLALPGTSLQVVDAKGARLRGEPGEILVRGPTLMSGYLGQATGAALQDGWLHTGDVGVEDADGSFRVLDRRSDLIISGGENIYPAEIESVLLEHPAVSEAVVTGCADPEYGSRPTAWLIAEAGQHTEATALRAFCEQRLARYKVPVAFTFIERMPRNASGKIVRERLGAAPDFS